ncbi:hypothetical protein, partial [Moorena sp. SIO2C4]|uniref:hypothetical protein n=1 Tax=Moorena sp. SIO2C4 TaxID=2607824 RepID=UPI0013CA7111
RKIEIYTKYEQSKEEINAAPNIAMQRGLGEAVRSWGGSAVLGVSPMSDCRGSPHEQLPWFPP